MVCAITILSLLLAASWVYIYTLKEEIRSYRATWNNIEKISDKNQDGDVIVHVKRS